jgi:antitoxin component YwqK of YwqJK toxin-antitoxin module
MNLIPENIKILYIKFCAYQLVSTKYVFLCCKKIENFLRKRLNSQTRKFEFSNMTKISHKVYGKGVMSEFVFEDRKLISILEYKIHRGKEILDGTCRQFLDNGITMLIPYKHGNIHGTVEGFDIDRKIVLLCEYSYGKKHGGSMTINKGEKIYSKFFHGQCLSSTRIFGREKTVTEYSKTKIIKKWYHGSRLLVTKTFDS